MLLLAVDTAGHAGSVMLARLESDPSGSGNAEVLGTVGLEPRKFSTQLIPAIAELLRTGLVSLDGVDAFAIVSGPGSFTGLRVGLSAVKALAEVTSKPVISISRLAIMASAAQSCGPENSTVHAVLDAGRSEFYHGIYLDSGRTCVAESLQVASGLDDSLKSFPGLLVASEPTVLNALSGCNQQPCRIPEVSVGHALPLIVNAWREHRFPDIALLDANYLRRVEPRIAAAAVPSQAARITR